MKLVLSPEGDRSVKNTDVPPAVPELGETSVACVVFCIQYVCIHVSERVSVHPPTCISLISVATGEVQVRNHTNIQFK